LTNPCEGQTVTDLTRETKLTMAQAARSFPSARLGRPVSASTVWRWCRKGVKVPGVGTVYLECFRLSGRWLTSVEAISRFAARQTPAMENDAPPAPRSPGRQRRASERAAEELGRQGI
jgi:hypothetical protein